jgi:hypothetical protein
VKSKLELELFLKMITNGRGLKHSSGAIYNPKSFLALRQISTPDKRENLVAQDLEQIFIG